ncbi:MAG: hypothetical protein L0154_24940 [Chloroflexi bacterium]|nr:hypothetical protein [Chloroflexota bacterium]
MGRRKRRLPDYVNRDSLTLAQMGISGLAQAVLIFFSLFPFAGLLIGSYYSAQGHLATRKFGRMILSFAVILHTIYLCVICPLLMYIGLSGLF